MNNEKVICKTKCKYKRVATIPAIIWWVLCVIAFFPTIEEHGGEYATFHYKDINDLVEDIEDSIVNQAVGNFDTYTEIGFPKNVHAIIASLVDLIESRPQVCKMLFENSDSFTTRLNEAFCDFNYKYFSDYHGDEKRIVYNFFYMFISNGFYGLVKYWLDNMYKMNKNELIGLCYIFVKRVLLLDKPDINAKDIST